MGAFKKGSIEKVAFRWALKNEYNIHPFIYLAMTHRSSGTPALY